MSRRVWIALVCLVLSSGCQESPVYVEGSRGPAAPELPSSLRGLDQEAMYPVILEMLEAQLRSWPERAYLHGNTSEARERARVAREGLAEVLRELIGVDGSGTRGVRRSTAMGVEQFTNTFVVLFEEGFGYGLGQVGEPADQIYIDWSYSVSPYANFTTCDPGGSVCSDSYALGCHDQLASVQADFLAVWGTSHDYAQENDAGYCDLTPD